MFGFLKRKRTTTNQPETNANETKPAQKYTCLFCKKTFTADEILFANTLNYPDPAYNDTIFYQSVQNYQLMNDRDKSGNMLGLTAVSRRFLDRSQWKVVKYEENGLPLMVKGPLMQDVEEDTSYGDGLGFGDETHFSSTPANGENEMNIVSSERLCPRCHFSLPEGFATDKVIQVGLLGGSRSGKTTYMAVATEYLKRKMGSLNSGLELAQVVLLPECQKYQDALYVNQQKAKGADTTAIVGDVIDKMVMPIIIRVIPLDKEHYQPFFLIFQDIPGEYLKPENNKFLLNSNIPKSNDLILLVDVNHFIETLQQEDESFGGYCKQDVNELFVNIENLSSLIPEGQLHSVQVTLTKLDFWNDTEKGRLNGAIFTRNCDEDHRLGIDNERLTLVHDQIQALLAGIGNNDQSGLLDNLVKSMNLQNTNIHKGYTAIASRIVPGHEEQLLDNGADYQSSLNVLEPLMNIFEWENVLPVKKNETNNG